MWCQKCSYGSESCILTDRCPQCSTRLNEGLDWLEKNPLPNRPIRSIRSLKKRMDYIAPKKDEKEPVSEDVAEIMKEAQHRD